MPANSPGLVKGSCKQDEASVIKKLTEAHEHFHIKLEAIIPSSSEKIKRGGMNDSAKTPRLVKSPQKSAPASLPTKDAIALAFADRYSPCLRFNHDFGRWLRWGREGPNGQGIHWQLDSTCLGRHSEQFEHLSVGGARRRRESP